MQVSMENQLSVGEANNIDLLFEKKNKRLLYGYCLNIEYCVHGLKENRGKTRSSLQQARQASKILEGYALSFQETQTTCKIYLG